MPSERFYSPIDLVTNGSIELQDQEFHHLVHVMRMQAGEPLEIVNGKGALAQGKIEKIFKKHALIYVQEVQQAVPPNQKIILVQAMPRLNRLENILEKGTELGMTELWLFPGERSERKKIEASQMARFQTMTIAALKQCGRLFLPNIILKPPLMQWLETVENGFFGDLQPDAPKFLDQLQKGYGQIIHFFIGPESGFSSAEEEKLRQLNVQGVNLHPNILRTDTAALAALALISSVHCS